MLKLSFASRRARARSSLVAGIVFIIIGIVLSFSLKDVRALWLCLIGLIAIGNYFINRGK